MTEIDRSKRASVYAIRAMLLASEDGLTSSQMGKAIGLTTNQVNALLNSTYGFYIDRWEKTAKSVAAVWMCVHVPANCPRPEIK